MRRDRQGDRPRTNKTKIAIALAAIFVVGLLSSGAFGMTSMIGGSTSTDTTTTATDPTTTDTSTPADTTTTTSTDASTTTTTSTTTPPPPPIFNPQIASDKDDYNPGDRVTLTGSNWQPGESVHIFVNDDIGQTWSYSTDVTAGATGSFVTSFSLPSTFIASYAVTATGLISGTAKTSFTDGNLTLHLSTGQGVTSMTVAYQSFGKNGSPDNTCSTTGTTPGASPKAITAGGTASIGIQSFESVKLGAVTSAPAGFTFDRWTTGTSTTDSGVTVSGSPTPCVSGSSGGTNGNVTDLYAHFVPSSATLTVIKHVVNDNGGTATAASFTMSVPGGTPSSFAGAESPGTTVSIPANTAFSVGETGPSGYTRSDSGTCSSSGLAAGATATCTVTNNDQAATLTVIKHVINNNGGTATAANFTMSVTGGSPSPASFAGAESPGTTVTLNANAAYSVGESGPSGYSRSDSAACASPSGLAPGTSATCTVTNDDQGATLTVIKHVINNNGGTATAANFTMSVSGGSPASFPGAESPGTAVTINANTAYSVAETGPSGYTRSDSAGCTSPTGLAPGGSATCTITNDDQAATLTVIKHVINNNGGTAIAANFTMSVTGSSPSPSSFAGAESPGTTVTLNAGTYSVGETGPSGYTRSDSSDCSGSIGVGQSKTCTVTNDDQAATLTVIKHVINNNGGTATAANFTMSVTGSSPSPASFAGAESPGTTVTLNAGSYSVGESGPSGYTRSDSTDCSGSIAIGQSKTCTVTNDDQPATLTVIKHVVNDNGGTATAANFTMSVAAGSPSSFAGAESPGTSVTINANTAYSVGESGPTGYTRSDSAACASASGLAPGGSATCTVTNNDQPATLTVIKHVINNNGGTATASNFTMTVSGGSPGSFPGAESPGTAVTINANTAYSVGESGPTGYTRSDSAACASLSGLAPGGSATCTVTNDDQPATLTLIKHVVNDNGGTKTAADFTMSVAAGSPSSFPGAESPGTAVTINANTPYSVGESGPSGYARSDSAACASATGLGPGGSATCTVTNDDVAPQLTVIKHVVNDNGGTATAANFTMSVTGSSPSPSSFPGAESPGTTVTLNAGSYSVGETGPSGYSRSDSADCSGSISVGQAKTCTVTNNDVQPVLHVIKHVINDNGGIATAGDFTMSVIGSSPSPSSFAGAESPGTTVAINAGSYSVGESGPSGYASSLSADCTGSLSVGDEKTCTVTNNDVQPKLYVIKHVVNDNGGTAVASNFTMSVTGSSPSPGSFPGAESPGTTVALDAGSYSVGESGPSGYSRSDSADCSGSLAVGQTKTCTVTNNDIRPILHVIKHVINDNGGTAAASNFTMSVTGSSPSPSSFPGAESPGTTVALDAGSYSVGETGPTGYSRSDSADCAGTLSVGDEKTCTVTNNDIQPILHVVKHVVNDNGGTAVASNFTMSVTGSTPSPSSFPGAESPGTTVAIDAGSYSVGESGPTGYARSDSADCAGTLSVGDEKTCTVTNNDIQPKLYVIKHVVNDNGGAAVASNFTMSVTGSTPSPSSFPGAESPGTTVALDAGSYSVGETGPSGYSRSDSSDCSGSIAVGQTKTCTVTNDDVQPVLHVIKHVVNDNGGTATAGDFTMSVIGSSPSPNSFPGAESPGTTVAIDAGSYSVGENGLFGYASSFSADCTGSMSVGDVKTCTVTNNDIQPVLHVIKHVINDNGGNKAAADFTMSVTGNNAAPASFAGAESPGTTVALDAGSYSVGESGPSGYTRSDSSDCSGSIAVGQTKTCTVTNNDQPATLIVIKHVVNDNGGLADASDFTMSVTGNNATPSSFAGAESPGTTVTLDANSSYSVGETGPTGYTRSDSADCAGSGIGNGQTKTCTVTNNDQPAKLVVIKHVINDDGGLASASDFTMSVTGNAATPASFPGAESPGTTVTLDANAAYSVGESGPSGYTESDSGDCTGTGIGNGQTKTCTVTNDDQPAKLVVIKHVVNDNGGTATAASFTMSVTGNAATPASFAGAESPGTTVTLDANSSYSVGETGPTGYARSDSADCAGSGIGSGQTKTCTVTNNDVQPILHVIKHVVNDNGGTKSAGDFTMNVSGSSPSPSSFAGDEGGTTVAIDAGSYSVTEGAHAGYADSYSADCTGSLSVGDVKTCTVTNNDIQPKLIVIKHVVNDNGGTKSAADFTLNVSGTNASPGSFPGAESPGTTVALDAGSYSVTEGAHGGYSTSSSSDCSGSIAVGETKTCTVTNDDIQPVLHVIKHVVNDNGGTAVASDFTMSVIGSSPSPSSFPGAESPGTTVAINAGSYSVGESGLFGYTSSFSADCTGSLVVGDEKTCTVTNNDIQPVLHVIKHVVNDDGGQAAAADFNLTVTGSNPSPGSFAGAESPGTTVGLDAGSYSVGETGPTGYTASNSADCSGSISVGQTKTCTVTNDDQPAKLVVIKHVINDDGGQAVAGDFTMTVGGGATNVQPSASFPGAESPGTTVTLNAHTSYSVGETGPSGYTRSDSADCSDASIGNGETKTCTVTNDDQPAKLVVIKHVINDDGGQAQASDFTMSVGGGATNVQPSASFPGAESPGTTVTLNAHTAYSVGESGPSGYTRSDSADCSGASIGNGETKTCTITNNDQPAKLIVIKHVVNNNGGPAVASDFTMSVGGGATNVQPSASFPGAESPGTTVTLNAHTAYSVGETGPTGYSRSDSADCAGASIANGETKTCTVTNDDIQPVLHVIKHVINNNGGAAVASDFTMSVIGTNPSPSSFPGAESPGTTVAIDAGSYSVGESGPNGYSSSQSADCAGTLHVGDVKTCTVTNDDVQPVLHVIKHVINDNGGPKSANDFTLNVSGSSPSPSSFAGAESPGTTVAINAGSYSVTEGAHTGYADSYSSDCTGTLHVGDEKTCTVTNNDIQPKLVVIKKVVNDNGGTKTSGDFTLNVSGTNASPASFPGADSPGTTVALDAGSYSVTEGAHGGYTTSSSADCSGSIAVGETKTCTVTNDDIQPVLHVIKHVVNDNGGTKSASDFTMNVSGSSPSPSSFGGAESPGTTVAINAGSYSVTEGAHTGYADSYSADCSGSLSVGDEKTCTVTNNDIQPKLVVIKHVINDNGGTKSASNFTMSVTGNSAAPASFPGAESPGTTVALDAGSYSVGEGTHTGYAISTSADCSGSIAVGETKTCTVTNNDQPAKLVVIKHVVNDNGGTATAASFTMSVTGASPSPSSFPGAESPGTNVALNAGSYSVGESGPSGYSRSDSAECSGSIDIGETKTCTITNDDVQPKLVVIKHVINDNGGTKAASDFTMSVAGSSPSPGSFPGDEGGTTVAINAGSYSVSESGPTSYSSSFSSYCTGSIAVGQTKTCTVTNNDIQPKLVVIKHVVNDNGGTASAANFTMSVTGASPSPSSFPGAESPGTNVALNAGSYSVGESGPSGYARSDSADCSGSIDIGQTKTCTVTNNDVQPKLIVIKHVVNDNGGTATAANFNMTVTGNSPSASSFPGAESPGTTVAINAGSYSTGETGPSGYARSDSSDCAGSIAVGQTKTCTITNDDIQPKLVVIKHVINDDGATKTAADFTMSVTGSSPTPSSFPGAESPGTNVAINAGSYSVGEGAHTGYAMTSSADCSGSIAIGQTKTCTITNDDDNQAPVITSFTGTNSLFGPLVFVPSVFNGTFYDSAINDNPWIVNWSFDGVADPPNDSVPANGTNNHTFGPRSHTYGSAGCNHSATVKVTDKDGAFDTKTITIGVGTGAFLPPVTNTPVTNKLKNGQVLPVKIQITDCNGAGVNNLSPAIRLVEGDQTSVPDDSVVQITPPSVSNADTTGVMRSSGSDGSYIYNMSVNLPKMNTDYTIEIFPYWTSGTPSGPSMRHVIQATK